MTVCGFLAGIGLSMLCFSQPEPAPVDQAAVEIQQWRQDIEASEKMADDKLDCFWGRKTCPRDAR